MNVTDEQRLRDFLKDRFPAYDDQFEATAPLGDVVDSLGLFELVEFVEREFGISIPTEEFTPQRFSTIASTLELVEELKAAQ